MSERYSKLFALSENLYSSSSPVIIAAGALQKDNQTGKVFAQLKMRSIQDKKIKAATVRLTPLDTVGKPLGEVFDYQYLDLYVKRDADFGQKTLIPFKDMATRAFTVSVSEVILYDNSVWTSSDGAWEPLSPPVTLETAFEDNELVKQYREKYGAGCKCIFKKEKDLWRCDCGAVNRDSETNCHRCQREAAELAALDVEELKAERDSRLAAERKRVEDEKAAEAAKKAAAEEKARKIKKIAMIAALIVVVVIVAAVLISNHVKSQNAYNAALALVEAGQYDKAVAAFTELGNFKDSAEQISETRYAEALTLVESGNYDGAIAIFTMLGDYKDSAEQISETRYVKALALRENGEYAAAIYLFTVLGDYKDSAEQIYNVALAFVEAGKYNEAVAAFTELGDYKDSAEQITETRYVQALSMFEDCKYDEAITAFTELGNYKDSAELANNITNNITDYTKAIELVEDEKYDTAAKIFSALGDFEDSAAWSAQLDLLKLCSPYIGKFVCTVEGKEQHLTSDFAIYEGYVCWEVDSPDSDAIGITNGDYTHFFFTTTPVKYLNVSGKMTVTDWWYGDMLEASFENGDIIITASGPSVDGKDYYNRQYTKVE